MMDSQLNTKVKKGISWAFAEKMLTEIMNFAISIVMARIIAPEEYGVIGIIQVFITLFSIFVTCGLGSALIQNKSITDEQVSTVFYINSLLGLLLYIVLFFSSPLIANFYNNSTLTVLIRVLSIKVPIASIYNIQQAYIQKKLDFKKFFYSSLLGTVAAGIAGIVMALHGFGVWALIAATLIDQIVDSIVLFISTKWLPRFTIKLKDSAPLFKFGLNVLIAEFVSRGYEQIRLLVIGKAYSGSDLAYNTKGQKLPYSIVDVTNSSIIRVMFPAFSQLQDDKGKMREVASKSIQLSTYLLAPAMIGLAAISYRLVPFLYTEKWNMCIPFLQLYCFTYLFHPIQSTNIKIIQACGRSDISLRIEIIKKVSGLIFLILAVIVFNSALFVAASFTAMSIVALIINSIPCKKLIGYGIKNEIIDIVPSICISLIMGCVVFFIGRIELNNALTILIQVVCGISVYLLLSFIIKPQSYKYLINFLKEILKKRDEK